MKNTQDAVWNFISRPFFYVLFPVPPHLCQQEAASWRAGSSVLHGKKQHLSQQEAVFCVT